MLWLVTKKSSHQIVSCNLHQEGGKHSLWVERINGKNMKIVESDDIEEVKLYRNAIHHAIQEKEPTLELDV